MTNYACSAKGLCEPYFLGTQTLDECQATCRSLDQGNNDTYQLYLITLSQDPELALQAPPSEQRQIIKILTGVTVKANREDHQVVRMLLSIYYGDYIGLSAYPEFQQWLTAQVDWDRLYRILVLMSQHYRMRVGDPQSIPAVVKLKYDQATRMIRNYPPTKAQLANILFISYYGIQEPLTNRWVMSDADYDYLLWRLQSLRE